MAGLVSKEGDRTRSFQCFPLMAILLAAGNRTVNYLSLDIEGAELKVHTHLGDKTQNLKLLDIYKYNKETFHKVREVTHNLKFSFSWTTVLELPLVNYPAIVQVLETLPWGSVDVEVVSVEVQHLESTYSAL